MQIVSYSRMIHNSQLICFEFSRLQIFYDLVIISTLHKFVEWLCFCRVFFSIHLKLKSFWHDQRIYGNYDELRLCVCFVCRPLQRWGQSENRCRNLESVYVAKYSEKCPLYFQLFRSRSLIRLPPNWRKFPTFAAFLVLFAKKSVLLLILARYTSE